MKIKNDCDSINFNCIPISSGEYLVYSNKFNSKNIILNVSISRYDDLVYDYYIGINNTDINDISDKMENLLSITSKFKKKNISALVLTLTFFPFIIYFLSIICCKNNDDYYNPAFLNATH